MSALASALTAAGVPAMMVGVVNEQALTNDIATRCDIPRDAFTIDGLTDSSPDGYQRALYANAMHRADEAGTSLLTAIAAMAVYTDNVLGGTAIEVTHEPKGGVAMAFWRGEATRKLVKRLAQRLRIEDATARRYLRLAVAVVAHPFYAEAVAGKVTLPEGEAAVTALLVEAGGTVRDIADAFGVKWSNAKAKASDDDNADPFAAPSAEDTAEAAKASAAKIERLNKSMTTSERAGVITLAAMVEYMRGAVISAEHEAAYLELATLIAERVDVSREDRRSQQVAMSSEAIAA